MNIHTRVLDVSLQCSRETGRLSLRNFYGMSVELNERRTRALKTRQAYQRIAAIERRRVKRGHSKDTVAIMCVGLAEMGVHSGVKGPQVKEREKTAGCSRATNTGCPYE